ncbi:DUF7010 family protein [Taibaiella koreensis]|uniref:DUF7010 family protein n=1 Tax=Taibaiella koreensis TaxID=1268548 RepID=UPI000E59B71A|nr:hypothetical protein [Taibaiella koreensis]
MDSLQEAQRDMSDSYGHGAIGVLVSGIVWLCSGLVVSYQSHQKGIWVLIIGGMLIFPLATWIGKLVGIKGKHTRRNPLGKLAMEGTVWMIMCIPLAYGLSLIHVSWFFQGMLVIIAGRYLTFASVYGIRLYWVLGAALGVAAYLLYTLKAGPAPSALAGGITEVIFGIVIYSYYKHGKRKKVGAETDGSVGP